MGKVGVGGPQRLTPTKERWLAELYETNADAVIRVCWRVLPNGQDAADACQEVFLRAANSLDADTPRDHARAWLLTVARNYCLDQVRRARRLDAALTRIGSDWDRQADPESAVVNRHTVDDIFRQLNERERTVLWQTAVEHRPLTEVADRLRLSYMAAGQVVSRARKHAYLLAAKVAAIFAIFRIITRRVGVVPVKLLAAATVPMVALTIQPSSSATTPSTQVATQPALVNAAQTSASKATTRAPGANPSGPSANGAHLPLTLPMPAPNINTPAVAVPSPVSSASGTVSGTVNQVLHTLPTPTPLPIPSLSPPPLK